MARLRRIGEVPRLEHPGSETGSTRLPPREATGGLLEGHSGHTLFAIPGFHTRAQYRGAGQSGLRPIPPRKTQGGGVMFTVQGRIAAAELRMPTPVTIWNNEGSREHNILVITRGDNQGKRNISAFFHRPERP